MIELANSFVDKRRKVLDKLLGEQTVFLYLLNDIVIYSVDPNLASSGLLFARVRVKSARKDSSADLKTMIQNYRQIEILSSSSVEDLEIKKFLQSLLVLYLKNARRQKVSDISNPNRLRHPFLTIFRNVRVLNQAILGLIHGELPYKAET